MSLTEAQKQAAHAPGSVAVLAGAGTGKTFLLTHRYLHHLNSGLNPLQIVATTFTDSAAAELRSRIRQAVREHYPDQPGLLAQLEIAPISTMHALCQQICREYPAESGLPAGFTVMDEAEQLLWFERNYPRLLSRLPARLFSHLYYSQMDSVLRELLKDPYQAERSLQVTQAERIRLLEQASDVAVDQLKDFVEPLLEAIRPLQQPGRADSTAKAQSTYTLLATQLLVTSGRDELRGVLEEMAVTVRVSKSKAWSQEDYETVRDAAKAMRERARLELATGLVTMDWAEADDRLEQQLPALREAFTTVNDQLQQLRRRERRASFDDLELGALRALSHDHVRTELQDRWRAFMIDEFQDTNPVQLELISRLSSLGTEYAATLTTVGDVKQSIYGFRRAAPELSSRLAGRLGRSVSLSTSFRSHHALLSELEPLFQPLLQDLHQSLDGHRSTHPQTGPFVQVLEFPDEPGARRAEARHLARLVRQMTDGAQPVWDKRAGTYRPAEPRDFAVLVRNQNSLPDLLDAFTEAGLPAVHTSGEDLLGTGEAQDALSLLKFLVNPLDDLALLSVLRSPFVTVSDRELAFAAADREPGQSWWQAVRDQPLPGFDRARAFLEPLLLAADEERPVRLLQLADRLSGYSAVLAGLSDSSRRLADWQGFLDFVLRLETGGAGLTGVVRSLRDLQRLEVELPRPQLQAGNAVSFMTIHRSKGLEWPVVIVPDLTSTGRKQYPAALLDDQLGCALYGADSDEPTSLTWKLLLRQSQERQELEDRRVLYVAATRAADRLIMSGVSREQGLRKTLLPALEASGLPVLKVEPQEGDRGPWRSGSGGTASVALSLPVLSAPVAPQLQNLSVTSLAYYAACPRRFEYRFVKDHPGSQPDFGMTEGDAAGSASGSAWRVGDLTHLALEHDITDIGDLQRYDPSLPAGQVGEALALAQRFRSSPVFQPARELLAAGHRLEANTRIELSGITFSGRIDALTDTAVIDYKTDRHPDPDRHAMQLALYARANNVDTAMLAYLRANELHVFDAEQLQTAFAQAEATAGRITAGDFTASPGPGVCRICEYSSVCQYAWKDAR